MTSTASADVLLGVPVADQLGPVVGAQRRHGVAGLVGDDHQPGAGLQQRAGLANRHGAAADDHHPSSSELQKYRVLRHKAHYTKAVIDTTSLCSEEWSRRITDPQFCTPAARRSFNGVAIARFGFAKPPDMVYTSTVMDGYQESRRIERDTVACTADGGRCASTEGGR